jgi:hypothetical protein
MSKLLLDRAFLGKEALCHVGNLALVVSEKGHS